MVLGEIQVTFSLGMICLRPAPSGPLERHEVFNPGTPQPGKLSSESHRAGGAY
jgi:hypothetical protein